MFSIETVLRRTLARCFDDAFAPLGISHGQFSLLMSLNKKEPPRLGEAAALLAIDRTTLTANLKPLERTGYVEVRPDPDDRRSRRLFLTDAGQAILQRAVPIWRAVHDDIDARIAGNPRVLRKQLSDIARSY